MSLDTSSNQLQSPKPEPSPRRSLGALFGFGEPRRKSIGALEPPRRSSVSGPGSRRSSVDKKGALHMVLVDGSTYAQKAFETALTWKKPEDKLLVVHAVEIVSGVPVGVGPSLVFIDPSVLENANESLKQRGAGIVKEYAKICEEKKIHGVTTSVLTTHNPKESVCKYAKDKGVDIIYVGTRGLGTIQRFFLGSFSNYVVSHAECDVMLVKHDPPLPVTPPSTPPSSTRLSTSTGSVTPPPNTGSTGTT